MNANVDLSEAIAKRDTKHANQLLDDHPELLTETTESGISFILFARYKGNRTVTS